MIYIKTYEQKKKKFIYKATNDYTICDADFCAKSDRTFDVYFFDFAENEKLQKIFFGVSRSKEKLIDRFSLRPEDGEYEIDREKHLLTNPELRIIVTNKNLFLDVLEIFNPNDIRVLMRKYNI